MLILGGCTSADTGVGTDEGDRLAFRSVPASAVAGQPFEPAVQVFVLKPDGEVAVNSTLSVTLTARSASIADTLRGDTLAIVADGIATFPTLRLRRVSPGTRLIATAPGVVGAQTELFPVRAGPPVALVYTSQPDSAVAGVPVPRLRIEARDIGGNIATSANGVVTVSVATGPSGAFVAGTATADLVQGVAELQGVILPRAGVGYTLQATIVGVDGVTPAITRTFSTRAGPAAVLSFDEQPSAAIAGQPMVPAVTVLVLDGFGNRVPAGSSPVTMEVATAVSGFTLQGTTTVAANAGLATFTNLRPDRSSPNVRLRAVSPGLSPAVSAAFGVSAATP